MERKVGAGSGISKLFLKEPDSKYLSSADQEAKLKLYFGIYGTM